MTWVDPYGKRGRVTPRLEPRKQARKNHPAGKGRLHNVVGCSYHAWPDKYECPICEQMGVS